MTAPLERPVPPTLVKRIMDHAVALGADPRVATQLGRMYLEGILTETESEAGLRYAEDVGRYEFAIGLPRRVAASPAFEIGYGDNRPDPSQRFIDRARKAYMRALSFIPEYPMIARVIIDTVCVSDLPVPSEHHAGIKALLGRLAQRCYHLSPMVTADEPRPRKLRARRRLEARDIAEGACNAVAEMLTRAKATGRSFEITSSRAGKWFARRLTAHGRTEDGAEVSKTLEIRLRGTVPAVMDAQLVRAAIARGWVDAHRERAGNGSAQDTSHG